MIVAEREICPLVPVTVTEYVPGTALLTERLVGTCWFGERVKEVWLKKAERPCVGDRERPIVPENPPRLIMLISFDCCTPTWLLIEDGPVMRKSNTLTLIVSECEIVP